MNYADYYSQRGGGYQQQQPYQQQQGPYNPYGERFHGQFGENGRQYGGERMGVYQQHQGGNYGRRKRRPQNFRRNMYGDGQYDMGGIQNVGGYQPYENPWADRQSQPVEPYANYRY